VAGSVERQCGGNEFRALFRGQRGFRIRRGVRNVRAIQRGRLRWEASGFRLCREEAYGGGRERC